MCKSIFFFIIKWIPKIVQSIFLFHLGDEAFYCWWLEEWCVHEYSELNSISCQAYRTALSWNEADVSKEEICLSTWLGEIRKRLWKSALWNIFLFSILRSFSYADEVRKVEKLTFLSGENPRPRPAVSGLLEPRTFQGSYGWTLHKATVIYRDFF